MAHFQPTPFELEEGYDAREEARKDRSIACLKVQSVILLGLSIFLLAAVVAGLIMGAVS